MPSRGELSNDRAWQLVACIRDMAAFHRAVVRTSRTVTMAAIPDDRNRNRQTPRPSSGAPVTAIVLIALLIPLFNGGRPVEPAVQVTSREG